eukprot:SAG11_NODE_2579_length_3199_cov_13.264194_2_plen_52_part_00
MISRQLASAHGRNSDAVIYAPNESESREKLWAPHAGPLQPVKESRIISFAL